MCSTNLICPKHEQFDQVKLTQQDPQWDETEHTSHSDYGQ